MRRTVGLDRRKIDGGWSLAWGRCLLDGLTPQ